MGCTNCGHKGDASCAKVVTTHCLKYDGEIPEWSDLYHESDVTVYDCFADILKTIDEIKVNISTASLGKGCMQYNDKKIKTIIMKFRDMLCKK